MKRTIRWIITIVFCTPFASMAILWTIIRYFSWRDSVAFLCFAAGSAALWFVLERSMKWHMPSARWGIIAGLTLIAFLVERGEKITKVYFPDVASWEIYGWAMIIAGSIGLGKFFAEKISGKIIKKIEDCKMEEKKGAKNA